MKNILKNILLPAALAVGAVACGDDTTPASTPDMTMATPDMTQNPDMTPPAAPALGDQLDRMGRPTINVAVTNPFDLAEPAGNRAMTRDKYNADADPTKWVANWSAQLQINLAAYDGADGKCGNQLLACGKPNGCDMTDMPAAGRYKGLGDVLADDRLYLDTTQTTCQLYLGAEAAALGLGVKDCGGRTPAAGEDVVDETYTLATVGLAGLNTGNGWAVTDGVVDKDGTNVSLTAFPFLDAPN